MTRKLDKVDLKSYIFGITESFNTNIFLQLFDYTITFVNLQQICEHKFTR